MNKKVRIGGCEELLQFKCPKWWSELQETEDPKVRFCHACQEQVYRCDDHEEFELQREQGHCVALNFYVRPMMGVPLRRLPKED